MTSENPVLTSVLEGLTANENSDFNRGLEAAMNAVIGEFRRLKDLGRQEQFDEADITTPINKLFKVTNRKTNNA